MPIIFLLAVRPKPQGLSVAHGISGRACLKDESRRHALFPKSRWLGIEDSLVIDQSRLDRYFKGVSYFLTEVNECGKGGLYFCAIKQSIKTK